MRGKNIYTTRTAFVLIDLLEIVYEMEQLEHQENDIFTSNIIRVLSVEKSFPCLMSLENGDVTN